MSIPSDQIDPDARKVLKRLVRHGHQAYLVGGCVRDLLLGRKPKDFDIATSATPNEVKAIFRNCRIIGRRFRLAHIFFGQKIIETATFRSNPREAEIDAGDTGEAAFADDLLIRRDNVFGTAEEDARRRDFTINGLFYDDEADEVIDYVGGLEDLKTRQVRTIGDADIRFREDPVRILRAIKFSARLDFDIEESAWSAILQHKVEIPKCAAPRVLEEIYRLLRGGAARRSFELMLDTGVLELLVPELAVTLREQSAPGSEGPGEAERLWRVMDRLDRDRRTQPTNAVLLCALLGAMVGEPLFDDGDRRDVGQLVEERGRALLSHMKASRRDVERARQILLAQRRIAPSKRRRGRVTAMVRRDGFDEALEVYKLVAPVVRPGADADEEVARWREQAGEPANAEHSNEPQAESVAESEAGEGEEASGQRPRRRRRRRGGRGRRRFEDAAEAESGAVQAPTLAAGGKEPS